MANAENTYVDPSALRRLYVHDTESRAFCALRARLRGPLPITPHGKCELVNSICLALFRGDLKRESARRAVDDLTNDLQDGRLYLADVPWRRVFDTATDLSLAHTPKLGTRTLDVLHVASAVVLGCKGFVTYDERQAKLARVAGLRLVKP